MARPASGAGRNARIARPRPHRRADAPARRRAGTFALLAALIGAAPAQDAASANAPAAATTFTAPDGSRFVLLPDPTMPLVHWATATLAQDPPGFAGLSLATARAALGGTWQSGSRDPAREPAVLDQLDAAYHRWFAARTPEHTTEVARLSALAAELGDPAAHARVLATVPMHRPEVFDRSPVVVHVTTTVPGALADAAASLLDLRERAALRELQLRWLETVVARGSRRAEDDRAALHAEVLALAMPDHPYLDELEQPGQRPPLRADALRTYAAMQRPERTVHVLFGGFDAAAARTVLTNTFSATSLPASAPPPVLAARPIASLRRSVVPGARAPVVALAFVLPPDVDPIALAVGALWLGGGGDSRLGLELPRRGRAAATVTCRAPWPPTVGGRSLLLLEVADPAGTNGLGDLALRTAREIAGRLPTATELDAALAAVQREWTATTNDPRRFVAAIAESAQLWPGRPPRTEPIDRVDAGTVRRLLARILAGQPVVVEARP